MDISQLVSAIHTHLLLYGYQYKFSIEAAAVAVLFYVGLIDFFTFKIRNDVVLLLLVLYVLLAVVSRSWTEIEFNILLAVIMSVILLWLFARRAIGGGDVKLFAVVCLWISAQAVLPFAILLLVLVALHVGAAKLGWTRIKVIGGRTAISYGPALAGALIGTIMLGYV
jgi:prepilin peptidase CpaA